MATGKKTAMLLAVVFLGANVAGLLLSSQRRQAEAAMHERLMQLKGKQGEAYQAWHAADSISIGSAECTQSLAQLGVAKLLPTPLNGQSIDKLDLDPQVVEHLNSTLADLLKAYRNGHPANVVKFMAERGETLTKESVERMKRHLSKGLGFDQTTFEGKSDEEIYALCWEADGLEPAFESFLPTESGITFWTITDDARSTITDHMAFGEKDFALWRWRNLCHDNFSNSSDTIDAQVNRSGSVTVADVRLVVKHRGGGLHSICPYVIRFWYSDSREAWVPCLFTQMQTSLDIPDKMYF